MPLATYVAIGAVHVVQTIVGRAMRDQMLAVNQPPTPVAVQYNTILFNVKKHEELSILSSQGLMFKMLDKYSLHRMH